MTNRAETKLQVAIDRVSLDRAAQLITELAPWCDIIEIGTSLTKEFGMRALTALVEARDQRQHQHHGGAALLADIKTCDEGAYEFDLGYTCGYDMLTVMGSASQGTLHACAQSAQAHQGQMMIDLLECSHTRVAQLVNDPLLREAIFCLHSSVDDGGSADPVHDVTAFQQAYPWIQRVAIAGGITENSLPGLAQAGTDIVIMGSAIVKAEKPGDAVRHAMALLHDSSK